MSAPRLRADQLLVSRGLALTRTKAQAAIAAGGVWADGKQVRKASEPLDPACALQCTPASAWVSRGGDKLSLAMDALNVAARGLHCLDIGASTGGFTQVLLARGAASVTSVDVGHGQLHPQLGDDPRVRKLEGQDARALLSEQLLAPPALIVCDASFIGADKVLARPFALSASSARALVLIKPPYEAGPGVRVSDANCWEIAQAASARLDGLEGFGLQRLEPSAVRGGDGSAEFIALLQKG